MSNNSTVNTKIPINRQPADQLINDTQSAIDQSLNSFNNNENNYVADFSLTQDDHILSINPNAPAQPARASTRSHADELNQDISSQPTDPLNPQEEIKTVEETKPNQTKKPETLKEYNFRMLRERAEAAEAQNKLYEQQMKQIQLNQFQSQNQYQKPEVKDELSYTIEDDAFIEGKDIKKIINNIKQDYKRELQEIRQHTAASAAETRLKSQFTDFDRVVNQDTIKTFAKIYPEEYASMLANNDMYAAGKTAYNMIKNFGIVDLHEPAPTVAQRSYEDENRRIDENLRKPRTAARVGAQADSSTLGRLNEYGRRVLTEADKQRVREKLATNRMFSH